MMKLASSLSVLILIQYYPNAKLMNSAECVCLKTQWKVDEGHLLITSFRVYYYGCYVAHMVSVEGIFLNLDDKKPLDPATRGFLSVPRPQLPRQICLHTPSDDVTFNDFTLIFILLYVFIFKMVSLLLILQISSFISSSSILQRGSKDIRARWVTN